MRACLRAESIDQVVVSTDHEGIAETARQAGAVVVERPAELSGATASSESAVLHALDALGAEPEVVVLVQCTSAFIDPADLSAAVRRVLDGEADSVVSGLPTHEFLWTAAGSGVNHDPAVRPRRQDREPQFRENGAFYVMRTAGLREHGHRFFGTVAVQPVPARHAIEVDDPEDLELVRALAPFIDRPEPIDVDCVITDFDGVHTDDRAYVDSDGREMVLVSRSDGMGVSLLKRSGGEGAGHVHRTEPGRGRPRPQAGRAGAAGPGRQAHGAARLAEHRGPRPGAGGVRRQRRQRPRPDGGGRLADRHPRRAPEGARRRPRRADQARRVGRGARAVRQGGGRPA
ncbi:acylneuraminate cytidylyltransferase [Nonomuraea salmonea]|uniref:acylneuraminate cytidylyltransferase n=1 Tax=Nonomuraea salmonea TaxID=46181 RepID=UPI002FE950CA